MNFSDSRFNVFDNIDITNLSDRELSDLFNLSLDIIGYTDADYVTMPSNSTVGNDLIEWANDRLKSFSIDRLQNAVNVLIELNKRGLLDNLINGRYIQRDDTSSLSDIVGLNGRENSNDAIDKIDRAVDAGNITLEQADSLIDQISDNARRNELIEEREGLVKDRQSNIDRKELLVNQDGAQEENVRGYDEAVRQIDARMAEIDNELNNLPGYDNVSTNDEVKSSNDNQEVSNQTEKGTALSTLDSAQKEYEDALNEYQNTYDHIEELERDITDLAPIGENQSQIEEVRNEINQSRADLERLGQNITDKYNALERARGNVSDDNSLSESISTDVAIPQVLEIFNSNKAINTSNFTQANWQDVFSAAIEAMSLEDAVRGYLSTGDKVALRAAFEARKNELISTNQLQDYMPKLTAFMNRIIDNNMVNRLYLEDKTRANVPRLTRHADSIVDDPQLPYSVERDENGKEVIVYPSSVFDNQSDLNNNTPINNTTSSNNDDILNQKSDDVITIAGIDYHRPRARVNDETRDEQPKEYEDFLKDYYSALANKIVNDMDNIINSYQPNIDALNKSNDDLMNKLREINSVDYLNSHSTDEYNNEFNNITNQIKENANKIKQQSNLLEEAKKAKEDWSKFLNNGLNHGNGNQMPGNVPLLPENVESREIIPVNPEPNKGNDENKVEEPNDPSGNGNNEPEDKEPEKGNDHTDDPDSHSGDDNDNSDDKEPEDDDEKIIDVYKEPNIETPRSGRPLEVIINELVKGLELEHKDAKRYNVSNIKVGKNFANKLKRKNYLYKVVAALNIGNYLTIPMDIINWFKGKITCNKDYKERVEILKSRINGLSEEDLMVIYNEYRSDRALQSRDMDILNTLLGEKISSFVDGKVAQINQKLTELYTKVLTDFESIIKIDKQIKETTDEKTLDDLNNQKQALLSGKAQDIKTIMDLQKEGRAWYSGGSHGFAEDINASKTKMSIVGYRFSKSNDTNLELAQQEADLVQNIVDSINNGDDLGALSAFLEKEKLLSDNTVIKNSIFGKRSVGDRNYNPLVTKVDYSNDPFVRDLMGAVASVGAVTNIVGQIATNQAILQQQNQINQQINDANTRINDFNSQVHDKGQEITNQSGTVLEGRAASEMQGNLGYTNTAERMTLDANDWHLGTDAYHNMDNLTHQTVHQNYDTVNNGINDVISQYQNGTIDVVSGLEQLNNITATQQSALQDLLTQYKPILDQYSATHSFDLDGLNGSINYLLNNPSAINAAANAELEIAKIGKELQQMNLTGDIAAIECTTTLWPALVGASSALIYAASVSNAMKVNALNAHYGSEIINKVSELSNEDIEELKGSYSR